MVYRRGMKKIYRKKYYGRRKKYGRVAPSVKQYVSKAIAKTVETKYHDQAPAGVGVDVSGYIYNILSVNTQGTSDYQQRVGDKIMLKSIKGTFQVNTGDTTNVMRCVLIIWHEDNSTATPSMSTLFTGPSIMNSPYNWDLIHAKKFTVLWDRLIDVNSVSMPVRSVRFSIKFKRGGRKIYFNGSTSNGTGIPYLVFLSDSGGVPNPTISNQYYRCTYTDA